MLHYSQFSMIRPYLTDSIYCIKLAILKNKDDKDIAKVIAFINEAISYQLDNREVEEFVIGSHKNGQFFTSTERYKIVIAALFNPNFAILNKMHFINNDRAGSTLSRKPKITTDTFDSLKTDIKEASTYILANIILKDKILAPFKNDIPIISKLNDEEIKRVYGNMLSTAIDSIKMTL